MDNPIDLAVFTILFGSGHLPLREDYTISEAGIFAMLPETAMTNERCATYQRNADKINLEFPCAYPDIIKWAEWNELIDVLMASELIAGANPETPLTKADKIAQEERILKKGPPTVSLRCFVDEILGDELDSFETLPTFYRLVEAHGLVVYDGVIDSNIVSSNDLLIALRHREQEADKAFDDTDFWFWKPFLRPVGNEVGYTLFRDDVARAYHNAGKPKFPWLDWNGNIVALEVEEHISIDNTWEFGLAAKPEDYQDAIKQDAWTWQEALCWLKGRFPDKCRLHQLPKYYSEEADLIMRAIKAGRMTAGSTSPKQWVEWAREKGWGISPLIEQYFPPDNVSEDKEVKLETVNDEPQKSEPINNSNVKHSVAGDREEQIKAVKKVAANLEIELLDIPYGGVVKIKAECLNITGFTDASFEHTWSEMNTRRLVKVRNKENYISQKGGKRGQ